MNCKGKSHQISTPRPKRLQRASEVESTCLLMPKMARPPKNSLRQPAPIATQWLPNVDSRHACCRFNVRGGLQMVRKALLDNLDVHISRQPQSASESPSHPKPRQMQTNGVAKRRLLASVRFGKTGGHIGHAAESKVRGLEHVWC